MTDFNQPKDHTMGGATETFRSGEFQVEQISVGGDFHWQNVRGRVLTMNGMFATTTPRNDASAGVGQWDVRDAYRYVSEAWGGYHFNVNHGLNVDAGIFVSYIGLFSYYNFDNWTYQPSFVSSNTPWFFNGLRIQWFPTNKLKIEPWIINGWQSYNRFNGHHGLGGQILYRPKEWLSLVFNNYGNGTDTLGNPDRSRIHTDDSIEVRYYNNPESTGISKMAFSFTADAGCEYGGGGTSCTGKGAPKQAFLGWMAYNRIWFHKDLVALTLGGGKMNNPGRYLTLLPPINGATPVSGSPYFTAESRRQGPHVGYHDQSSIHAETVHYLVGRGRLSPLGCSVLVGSRRDYSSRRQQRLSWTIRLPDGRAVRHQRSADSLCELRWAGQRLVPGSATRAGDDQRRRDGQVLTWYVGEVARSVLATTQTLRIAMQSDKLSAESARSNSDEWPDVIRTSGSNADVGVLFSGKAKPLVRPGVLRLLRPGIVVRLHAGSLALRSGRGCVVCCRAAPMVARTGCREMTHRARMAAIGRRVSADRAETARCPESRAPRW